MRFVLSYPRVASEIRPIFVMRALYICLSMKEQQGWGQD